MGDAKQEKRDLIIQKAREAFERFGLRKTTMDDIAHGCGLRKASLYYYFKSKEAIVAEMMRRVGDELCGRVSERVAAASSCLEAFRAFFAPKEMRDSDQALFLLNLAREDLFGLLPLAGEAMKDKEEKLRDTLRDLMRRGTDEGTFHLKDPERTADALHSVYDSIHLSAVVEGVDVIDQKQADFAEVIALVERGMLAPLPS